MQSDPHQRARFLIDEALVAGVASDDERWLRGHTANCYECSRYAELTSRMVRGLREVSFESDPGMAARVQSLLATRSQRSDSTPHWRWGLIAAALLIAIASPFYKNAMDKRREAEMERADTILLQRVNARVSQTLPAAMEPLLQTQTNLGGEK